MSPKSKITRALRVATATARPGVHVLAGSLTIGGEDRKLLLQLLTATMRTLGNGRTIDEQFAALLAFFTGVFEDGHSYELEIQNLSVTAPSEADATVRAYLPRTPLV